MLKCETIQMSFFTFFCSAEKKCSLNVMFANLMKTTKKRWLSKFKKVYSVNSYLTLKQDRRINWKIVIVKQ